MSETENYKTAMSRRGALIYAKKVPMTCRLNRKETERFMQTEYAWEEMDEVCEVVHIEVTPRCNRSCSYCYNPKNEPELTTRQLINVIRNIAHAGVFQITFGGGEPTMRDDIPALARAAKYMGLNVCMTTNGDNLRTMNPLDAAAVVEHFGQVNLSYHGDWQAFSDNMRALNWARGRAESRKIGVNFCCRQDYLERLEDIASLCQSYSAELLLLSYKAVREESESLSGRDILKTALNLASRYKITTAVDGSCVRSCMASIRFCDVHPNGDVSVCSFKREPIGNLLEEKFEDIWARRPRKVTCPYFTNVENDPDSTDW